MRNDRRTRCALGAATTATLALLVALTGRVAFTAGAPVVLFDEGHGQLFSALGNGPLDLSGLAGLLTRPGGVVKAVKDPLRSSVLGGASALVVSGAFRPIEKAEIDDVVSWVERGGRLSVMIHVEPPQADLLHRLGVSISTRPIREVHGVVGGDALNFAVTALKPRPLTRSITSFNVYGAWALLPAGKNAEPIAETSPQAWVDLNGNGRFDDGDARESFAVAVEGTLGEGRFFVLGDDAALQNRFLSGGNLRLGANLAGWLLRRPAEAPPASRHERRSGRA